MRPPLRAVIFDLGNTLVSVDPALHSKRTDYADVAAVPGAERMTRHLEARGLVPREAGLAFLDRFLAIREGNRARADESGYEITAAHSLGETFEAVGLRVPDEDAVREALRQYFSVEEELLQKLAGADETLARVTQHGVATALLSNATDGSYVARGVERFGWRGYFSPLVVSADIGVRKPRAEAFEAVLAAWPFAAEEVAVVGDSLRHDVDGGNRLGLTTVHFTQIPNPVDPGYVGRVIPSVSASSHETLLPLLLELATPD